MSFIQSETRNSVVRVRKKQTKNMVGVQVFREEMFWLLMENMRDERMRVCRVSEHEVRNKHLDN